MHTPLQCHSGEYSDFWSHTGHFHAQKWKCDSYTVKLNYFHLFSSGALKKALELQGFESKGNGELLTDKSSSRITAIIIPVNSLAQTQLRELNPRFKEMFT